MRSFKCGEERSKNCRLTQVGGVDGITGREQTRPVYVSKSTLEARKLLGDGFVCNVLALVDGDPMQQLAAFERANDWRDLRPRGRRRRSWRGRPYSHCEDRRRGGRDGGRGRSGQGGDTAEAGLAQGT